MFEVSDTIITDFYLTYDSLSSNPRNTINYSTDEFAWQSLTGNTPIQNIIISGSFTMNSGKRYPISLPYNKAFLMLLKFRKIKQ